MLHEASFYILFGLFFSGIIYVFINPNKIKKYLGARNFKSVFLSSLFGIPLPLCSCGVFPMAISLRKSGASKGSTLSFLISTPETGVDSILLSYALLDPIMATVRPIVAFVAAIIAGVIDNCVEKKDERGMDEADDHCCHDSHENSDADMSMMQRLKNGLRYAFVDLLEDIGKWFMLGIVLAGLIAYFVPAEFIENNLSDGIGAMLIMLVAGIPLYICASASTPIVAALILKGMSPGVALVFLLAGPATNAATITMVARFLGVRSVIVYVGVIAVTALGAGLALNGLYDALHINPQASVGHMAHIISDDVRTFSVYVFLALMGFVYIKMILNKESCH